MAERNFGSEHISDSLAECIRTWLSQGRLTSRDIDDIHSPHTGAKIDRLLKEDRDLMMQKMQRMTDFSRDFTDEDEAKMEADFMRRSRRDGFAEDLGYRHGCSIISGVVIGIVALIALAVKGC